MVELLEDRVVPDSGGATGILAAATPTGVTYGGGPLISSVSIHAIFMQDAATGSIIPAAERAQFHTFFSTITSDGFIPTLMTEYNAGSYTFGNGSVGADDLGAPVIPDTTVTNLATGGTDPSISDANIQSTIMSELAGGYTGPYSGNANNIYFVFVPPGDAAGDNSSSSVNDFLGYHSAISDPLSPTGLDYYAVIPDQSLAPLGGQAGEYNGNSTINGLNAFQGMCQTISHEMIETITDANVANGWIDPSVPGDGGEIGDHAANETYVQDGYNVQYMWSNTLAGANHAPSFGANDLFINQLTPPAVTGVGSVPVATFTSSNTSLTASQFYVAVQDGTSPYPYWSNPTVSGSNGHFVISATPAAGTDTAGAHGSAFNQDGMYVFVSTSPLDFTNGAPTGQPISVRYAPYVVANSAPFNYTADSGSGTNNFVLKEVSGKFQLTDNGLVVFTQPISQTTTINIKADPAVPGNPTAKVNDSLTIDYSGGVFSNAVNFDGGPGSATHTLTITGATFPSETYAYSGPHSGTITIGSQIITYTNVTSNVDNTTVSNLTLNLTAGTVAALQDDGVSNNGFSQIVSSNGTLPTTTFMNPATSLTVALNGSASNVQLKTMDAAFHPTTEILSSTSGGDIFQFVNAGAVSLATSVTLTLAELDLNGNSPTIDGLNGTGTITNTAAGSATLAVGAGGSNGSFSGTIHNGIGSIALTKLGFGVETLANANTYSGATTISTGTLANAAVNALPTGTSMIDNGVFDLAGFAQQVANVTGSGTLTDSGAPASFTAANSSADTFGGAITGSLNLVAAGAGALTLTGANNTYTGATTINAGATIIDGVANAMPTTTALTVAGTLSLNGFAQQVGIVTGVGVVTDSGAATNFTVANSAADTFGGSITGNISLTVGGTAALTLTAATSTYTGTTGINAGATLNDGVANALPIGTSLTVIGTLNLASFAQQVASITGSGIATDSGSAATFTVNNSIDDSFAGAFTGNLALTKIGSGTLTLTGTSSASGATTVSAGTLQVNGSITSNVAVASAATLDGTGSTGAVTVQNGGFLYPNASINDLSTNSVNMQAGAVYDVAVAGSSNYGQVNVLSGTVTLATTGAGAKLNLATLGGFHPLGGDQYVIVNNSGSSAQTISGALVAGTGIDVPAGTVLTEGMVLSNNFLGSSFTATITYHGGVNQKSIVIVVLNSAPFNYTGTATTNPNNFRLIQDGANLDLFDNGVLVDQRSIQSITVVNIGVSPGLDATLIVDYSGGLFSNNVNFDGGTGNVVPHTVIFEFGAFTNETYTYTDFNTASVNLDGQVMSLDHISSIADSLSVANMTFNLPAAAQAALDDVGPSNDGWSQFAPLNGGFVNTSFSTHPTTSLAINTAGSGSHVQLESMDATFTPATETFAGVVGDIFQLINNNAVASGTSVTVTTAILDLNGQSPAINGLAGNGTISDTSLTASTLTIGSNDGGGTFSGHIQNGTGVVSLGKTGGGSETFSGTNTYSGTTVISAGAIVSGAANALPNATALTDNGTFDLGGFAQQVGSITGAGSVTDTGAAASFTIANSSAETFGGTITGAANLVAAGSANLTLASGNTYTGTTTINSGATLAAGINNSLPATTSVNVAGLLDLASFNQQVAALTGSGGVTNSTSTAATFTVGMAAADTFAGTLTGNLALTKAGAGTLSLTNTNTYAGATLVSAGTLEVDGSIASDVAVAGSGTLAGVGTTGALSGAGKVAPGDAGNPGILNTNALSLSAGASFNVVMGGSNNVSQDNVTSGTVALSTSGAGVSLNLSFLTGFQPQAGDEYIIIDNSAASAQAVSGLFKAGAGIDNLSAGAPLTEGIDLSDNFLGSGKEAILTYTAGPNQSSVAIKIYSTFSYNGGPGTHNFLLTQSGANLNLYDNNFVTPVLSQPLAVTIAVFINVGQNNDSSLTIDYGGGQFGTHVNFNGGSGTAAHTLTLENGAFTSETFTYSANGSGSLLLDNQPIAFSNLSVSSSAATIVNNNLAAANVVFNLPNSAQATLQDDGNAGNGLSKLVRTSGAVETTVFANPSTSLTINGSGGDLLQLATLESGFNPITESLGGHANDTFKLASSTAIPSAANLTLNTAVLDLHGMNPIIGALDGSGAITNTAATASTLSIGNNNADGVFAGVINNGSAAIALVKKGTGTETLAGAGTYTGGTTIASGTLKDGIANALPAATNLILGNGSASGLLDLNGFGQTVVSVSISGSGVNNAVTDSGAAATFTVNNSTGGTFAGSLTGNLVLSKSGTGTLTLSTVNSYSGPTTILAGTLREGAFGALPASTALSVTGVLDLFGFDQQFVSLAGTGTITNSSATSADLTLNNTGNETFAGAIAGNVALSAVGPGVLNLTKASTFSGGTSIGASATVALGVANALPIATALNITGVLDLFGFNQQVGNVVGSGTVTNSSNAATSTFTISDAGTDIFFGIVTGRIALAKSAAGVLTLTSANTYSGSTTVTAGTLQLGAANAIPGNSDVTVKAILDLHGFSVALGSLSGSGTVTDSVADAITLTVGANNNTGTFSGVLQNGAGAVSLVKIGSGVQILSGANTLTGTTTLNSGTLTVNGTLYAPTFHGMVYLITPGVTLNGTGTVRGEIDLAASTSLQRTHLDGVTISVPVGGTGITVDSGATFAQIGASKGVTINGGNATSTGISIQGSASIFNSKISGHHIDVDVNGGSAALQGNTLNAGAGSYAAGLEARNGAVVDAGQLASDAPTYGDITGLFSGTVQGSSAHSAGNNTFNGYTANTLSTNPTAAQAIRDLNTGPAPFGNLVYGGGPQLGRMDLTARNNIFDGVVNLANASIQKLVFDEREDHSLGFVLFGLPQLSVSQTKPPTYLAPGSSYGSTLHYANTDLSPSRAVIRVYLSSNMTLNLALNPGWVYQGGCYIYDLGILPPGSSGTVHINPSVRIGPTSVPISVTVAIAFDPLNSINLSATTMKSATSLVRVR